MTDREEFEAWAAKQKYATLKNPNGEYAFASCSAAWQAWQARGAKKVKLPEKYYPSYDPDTGAFMVEWERGDWMHIDDVRDAIKAAGYEVE